MKTLTLKLLETVTHMKSIKCLRTGHSVYTAASVQVKLSCTARHMFPPQLVQRSKGRKTKLAYKHKGGTLEKKNWCQS